MLLNSKTVTEREKTNETLISSAPVEIRENKLVGDMLLIRCFYYPVDMSMTENGVMQPVYKTMATDGGKPVANMQDYPFQDRGVVINVGVGANSANFKVGDIVWISNRSARMHDFFLNKENPVASVEGYKLIPAAVVEMIEKDSYVDKGNVYAD